MYKPKTETAYEKASRIPDNFLFHFEMERRWSKQIIDILYREVWNELKPGIKHMLFIQTQSFLKRVYDDIKVPDNLCLDVYGRLSRVTNDWIPESNEISDKDYNEYAQNLLYSSSK